MNIPRLTNIHKYALLLITMLLISCSSSSNVEADDTSAKDEMEMEEENLPTEPSWEEFRTYIEGQKGFIWNEIKLSDDGIVVWVKYESKSEHLSKDEPRDSRVCHIFDVDFMEAKVPSSIEFYDGSQEGKRYNYYGKWEYVVPDTEIDNIAKEVKRILRKYYPFNSGIISKISDRKNNPQNKSNLEE